MKNSFQRYNMIDIIANGQKPVIDKIKIFNVFLCKLVKDCYALAKELMFIVLKDIKFPAYLV